MATTPADKDPRYMTPEERMRLPKTKREDLALTMRLTGASYDQINKAFGYKRVTTIERLVQGALKRRTDEDALQIRTLDLDRLDRMLVALWPQCISGDQSAIKTAIRILQHKADIVPGLTAPARLAGFDGGAIKVEDVSAAKEELREKLIDLAERRRAREAS